MKEAGIFFVFFRNLTDELLSPENLPHVTLLNAMEWAQKIKEENDEYSTLSNSRIKEEGERPSANVHDARDVIDPIYHDIVNRINAQVTLNGEANYISFITQLNGAIEELKTTMSQQQSAKKKDADKKPE